MGENPTSVNAEIPLHTIPTIIVTQSAEDEDHIVASFASMAVDETNSIELAATPSDISAQPVSDGKRGRINSVDSWISNSGAPWSTRSRRNFNIAHGAWPSSLHSFCVRMMCNIGGVEYILAPTLASRNGGIVYYLVLTVLVCFTSLPIYFLESIAGKYTSKGSLGFLQRFGSIYRGFGFAMLAVTSMVFVHRLSDVSWIVLYAYYAGTSPVQWKTCSPDFNSKHCYTANLQSECNLGMEQLYVYYNFSCIPASEYCELNGFGHMNGTHCLRSLPLSQKSESRWYIDQNDTVFAVAGKREIHQAAEVLTVGNRMLAPGDFFLHFVKAHFNNVISNSTSRARATSHKAYVIAYTITWLGTMVVAANTRVAAWISVVICAVAPLVTLLVLSRVVALRGALTGIGMFFYSETASLSNVMQPGFWTDCITMTYWSVNVGMGVVPVVASRDLTPLRFYKSALLIFGDLAFGLLNVLQLFAMRGNLDARSPEMHQEVLQLDRDSRALVFVSFTSAVESMPRPGFWGVAFFSTMALQMICRGGLIYLSMALNLVDSMEFFQKRPLLVALAAVYLPSLMYAALIMAGVSQSLSFAVRSLVMIEWNVVCLAFVVIMGLNLSTEDFLVKVRERLGVDIKRYRIFLVICWLVIGPGLMVIELEEKIKHYRLPSTVDTQDLWLPVLSGLFLVSPIGFFLGGVWYACRTTPFHALCSFDPDIHLEPGVVLNPRQRRPTQDRLQSLSRPSTAKYSSKAYLKRRRDSLEGGSRGPAQSGRRRSLDVDVDSVDEMYRREQPTENETTGQGAGFMTAPIRVIRSEGRKMHSDSDSDENDASHL